MNSIIKEFQIDISNPSNDFNLHLSIPNNERIIFSGNFGTGKTYFLNEYFKKMDNYEVVHLYPVNYSVASNEDIFELIKYDLAFELIKKPIEFEKLEFPKEFTAQFFIQDNLTEILTPLIENTSKLGKSIVSIGKSLIELNKKFEEFHQTYKKDDKKDLMDFFKKFSYKKGSIFEEDNISKLIYGLVYQLKEQNKNAVLIIDDLDRIDPEHIFRLLNIFAAHFDINKSENKFGFDKVIFVCDIENIRNIFHTKYGIKTDFSGYIDKFYSTEIFKFNNRKMISDNILKILSTIKIDEKFKEIINFSDPNKSITNEIYYILQGLVISDAINLRSIIKLYNSTYNLKIYDISYGGKRKKNYHFGIILIFDFLTFILGNTTNLIEALKKCESISPEIGDPKDHDCFQKLGNLVTILDINRHAFNFDEIPKAYNNEKHKLEIGYTLERYSPDRSGLWASVSNVNFPGRIKYFSLLQETYEKLISLNMLK